jgi:hypothetical protein
MIILNVIYNGIEQFIQFTVDNGVFSLIIAAIIGIAISNLVSSIKKNIIDYYLNKFFNTNDNNLISLFTSILQFILILYFLYILYEVFIKHIILKYQKNVNTELQWRNQILNELKELNNKIKPNI